MSVLDRMVLILMVILLGGVVSFLFGFKLIAFLIMTIFMISTLITVIVAYIKLMK